MAGRVKESALRADSYDYFANWFTPVIRELVCLHDFKENYKNLASMVRPSILPSEAKAAVKLLVRLKLVRRQADGSAVAGSDPERNIVALRTLNPGRQNDAIEHAGGAGRH